MASSSCSCSAPPPCSVSQVTYVALAALVLGGLVLRAGIFLTDAAEDFERAVHSTSGVLEHIASGTRRLSGYFFIDTLLATLVLVVLVVVGSA